MFLKRVLFVFTLFSILLSCTEDKDITVPRNLQEYIAANRLSTNADVIACAGNADANTSLTFIYYFPPEGANDIRYYETDSIGVDVTDFTKFKRKNLPSQSVFGGKLARFSRADTSNENWCLVTYVLDGELLTSNPIRLKNVSNPTKWTDTTVVNYKTITTPIFNWGNVDTTNSAIYFQVLTEVAEDKFISGTYTNDTFFQYYDPSNVVLDINGTATPEDLEENKEYLFTVLGVSEDNWVNTVDERKFIPGNLQRYITENASKQRKEAFAFGASDGKENTELTYLYYHPIAGASDLRYYETENVAVDENDFTNYRQQNLADEAVFGGRLRRYLRPNNLKETWAITTYVIADTLYTSKPIKIQVKSKPTEWISADSGVQIDYPQTLRPRFTWNDGKIKENTQYFKVLSSKSNDFITGVFTEQKVFNYYNENTITSKIHTETPPALVFDDEYNLSIIGLSTDNWANLFIQRTFKAQ